jgi:hypothetical protein
MNSRPALGRGKPSVGTARPKDVRLIASREFWARRAPDGHDLNTTVRLLIRAAQYGANEQKKYRLWWRGTAARAPLLGGDPLEDRAAG